jgi:Fur family ferric uptake transcriptional regulator
VTEKINLKEQGLTETTPRLAVLKTMEANKSQHLSAEDIYRHLLEHNRSLPMSTVYRVLSQFEQAGIIERHSFDAERTKHVYELNDHEHHDHMICVKCRSVHEFVDSEIESRQMAIAKGLGFELTDHSLNMYGICAKCAEGNVKFINT